MAKRIKYLDIAKGFAIIAVVFYHTRYLPFQNITLPLITSWMLPIFAVIGGLLFKHDSKERFLTFTLRKFKQLIIPYLLFGGISFLIWLLIRDSYHGKYISDSVSNSFLGLLVGKSLVFNGPLWFLPCYFLTVVFVRTIKSFLSHSLKAQLIAALALFIISYAIALLVRDKYFYTVQAVPIFSFFYLVGVILRKAQDFLLKSWGAVLLSLIFFVPISLTNGVVDIYGGLYGNFFLYAISAVLGSYIALFASRTIEQYSKKLTQFFLFYGGSSMTVLAVHFPLMQYATIVTSKTSLFSYAHGVPNLTSFDISFTNGRIFFLFGLGMFLFYSTVALAGSYLVIRLSKKL